jgi:preflagellin peptidase FlaK
MEPNITLTLTTLGISMIIVPLAIVMWRIGFFGGADAFCLIVLSGLAPMITISGDIVTPFTTLTNAAILSIMPLFANVIRNSIYVLNHKDIFYGFKETKFRKICAMFLGYRSSNPKYSFSIEKIEDGYKKLNFSLHHAENADFCNVKNSWITPGIPYVLYFTIGFLIQLFFGDMLLNTFTDLFIKT